MKERLFPEEEFETEFDRKYETCHDCFQVVTAIGTCGCDE